MNALADPWAIAVALLAPALALAALAAWRGRIGQRFTAYQFVASVSAVMLTLLAFATDQPSFTDLALTLALLNLPGTLLFAVFLERWL